MLPNYEKASLMPKSGVLADRVRARVGGISLSDKEIFRLCEDTVFEEDHSIYISSSECARLIKKVYSCLRCELEILQEYVDDPEISEVMVNGINGIFVEKNGRIQNTGYVMDSKEQLRHIIQRLAAKVGREMNDLNPIVDARLSDGSRINAVNDNIAIDGPILTIRKFTGTDLSMEDLIEQGDISTDAADFLAELVRAGYNIFLSGGTSSGKTTFLNILSDYIPEKERLVLIEDSAELKIRGHENLVRMESKAANASGRGAVTIKDLIKTSLRMRPDRIIVGEVRGDEVVDMLAAMSTGHDGSLSTGHANSPEGMLRRLETLHISSSGFPLEAVRAQIAEAIEIIVQLKRFPDGHRRVIEISEVYGIDEKGSFMLNRLYGYDKVLKTTGQKIKRDEKLRDNREHS